MTRHERQALKDFLDDHWATVTIFVLIAFAALLVALAKANNHLPQACPKSDRIGTECFLNSRGYFDLNLFATWMLYGIGIALIPAATVMLNHLVFKGREKVGLTPEARRERIWRLEHERDEAERRRAVAEQRTHELEEEMNIGRLEIL